MTAITVGRDRFNGGGEVLWNSDTVINPHWLILGYSGSGKTWNIVRILNLLAKARCFVFDAHGDIETDPFCTSVAIFGNSSSFGINPLEIDPDPEYGGLLRRIRTFLSMIDKYSCKLGINQEAVMRGLLLDLYAGNGIRPDNPSSWRGKRQPTLEDLKKFTYSRLKKSFMGGDNKTHKYLKKLNRAYRDLDRGLKDGAGDIDVLRESCKEAFSHYIDGMTTGRDLDDLIKYHSKDTLRGVYNRIDKLSTLGVFGGNSASFDPSRRVWRYDMRTLTDEEQGYLVETYLEKIFLFYRQKGLTRGVRAFVVLDEAHKFVTDDGSHIINLIMREGRKFGLGLILASQSLAHFSEDVITNCATKLILGVDEIHRESFSRKLGTGLKNLRYIQPRKTALVQVKTGDAPGRYASVNLPQG